jgi:hypothetical protein
VTAVDESGTSEVLEGSHRALMAQGGHYAELYNTYFRHQSPDYNPEVEGQATKLLKEPMMAPA